MSCRAKGHNAPRIEVYDDCGLPDLLDCEYLHECLHELGYAVQSFTGYAPLGWPDIEAWHNCSGYELQFWDLVAIRRMSEGYAFVVSAAEGKDYIAPYSQEEIDPEEAAQKSKSVFEKYLNNG